MELKIVSEATSFVKWLLWFTTR